MMAAVMTLLLPIGSHRQRGHCVRGVTASPSGSQLHYQEPQMIPVATSSDATACAGRVRSVRVCCARVVKV